MTMNQQIAAASQLQHGMEVTVHDVVRGQPVVYPATIRGWYATERGLIVEIRSAVSCLCNVAQIEGIQ